MWEARDHLTSEVVAVKVIQPHLLASPSAHRRFLREVASARSLHHPHTVQVLAHGRTLEGNGYLVMERLVGVTLSSRLAETGPLEQQRAIKIAAEILDAAGAAHRLQIIHRDLKPSNVVLIDRDGDPEFVKVCDFGLAKAIEIDDMVPNSLFEGVLGNGSTVTEAGEICGTPAYMAPEQARGEELDGRADLYAVGVLLFEAIVGRVPFSGRSPLAVISQHLSAAPPRPSAVRPDLGIFPPLENILLRALAKNRAERPSSAEVFRADLLQIERDLMRELRRNRTRRETAPHIPRGDALTLPNGVKHIIDDGGGAISRKARLAVAGGAIMFALLATPWFGGRRLLARLPGARVLTMIGAVASPSGVISNVPPSGTRRPGPVPVAIPSAPESWSAATVLSPGDGKTRIGETAAALPHPLFGETKSAEETSARRQRPFPSRRPLPARKVVFPEEAARLIEQAEGALGHGRILAACELGREASLLAPRAAQPWEFLGRCHMRLGQPAEARVAYRRYLAIAPDGANAVFVRAMIERGRP